MLNKYKKFHPATRKTLTWGTGDGYIHIYLFFQHPQIQKKSQYIKYLCCDDVRTLHQWVNGIRIAKVGLNPSFCFDIQHFWNKLCLLISTFYSCVFSLCTCAYVFCVVWETTIYELPGGHEEDRGSLRLVLALYLQHPIRLQFCQHTWLVHCLKFSRFNRLSDLYFFKAQAPKTLDPIIPIMQPTSILC